MATAIILEVEKLWGTIKNARWQGGGGRATNKQGEREGKVRAQKKKLIRSNVKGGRPTGGERRFNVFL